MPIQDESPLVESTRFLTSTWGSISHDELYLNTFIERSFVVKRLTDATTRGHRWLGLMKVGFTSSTCLNHLATSPYNQTIIQSSDSSWSWRPGEIINQWPPCLWHVFVAWPRLSEWLFQIILEKLGWCKPKVGPPGVFLPDPCINWGNRTDTVSYGSREPEGVSQSFILLFVYRDCNHIQSSW